MIVVTGNTLQYEGGTITIVATAPNINGVVNRINSIA